MYQWSVFPFSLVLDKHLFTTLCMHGQICYARVLASFSRRRRDCKCSEHISRKCDQKVWSRQYFVAVWFNRNLCWSCIYENCQLDFVLGVQTQLHDEVIGWLWPPWMYMGGQNWRGPGQFNQWSHHDFCVCHSEVCTIRNGGGGRQRVSDRKRVCLRRYCYDLTA